MINVILSIFSDKLAQNVNADEAAVLGIYFFSMIFELNCADHEQINLRCHARGGPGAAFRGASISNQFRLTQEIKIKDVTTLPIQIVKESDQGMCHISKHMTDMNMVLTNSTDDKHARTTLYNEYGTMGMRKIVHIKKMADFEFDLVYGKTLDEEDKYGIQ
jgi:hypothetical protein